ncbi:hypothetical protein [Shewanella woodyi]|uniref:hypothetical protein n=1 Tax=Shewanella woodyi TaxID=60961 RepID=UPI0007E96A52|nr:hypothetical protein [Shewanella woodyi]
MKYSLLSTALLFTVSLNCFAHSEGIEEAVSKKKVSRFQCDQLAPTHIKLEYDVIESDRFGTPQASYLMRLIKNQHQVIYQTSPQTFEAWDKNGEYIRYFPEERRSITYRPSDLRSLNISYDLLQQFHLVSPELKSQLQRGENTQASCFRLEQYSGLQGEQNIKLKWIESLALPYQFSITHARGSVHYQLRDASPMTSEKVNTITQGYNDLDFADVGDSESDPFIAKMITQGFIQHGSSGFYDTDGNSLSGGDHHGHAH